MNNTQVRIVTDGGIALSPEIIHDLHIAIIPSLCKVGKQTFESNTQTPLTVIGQQAGKKRLEVHPPSLGHFLKVYKDLGDRPVISIHSAHTLSRAGHVARVARNLVVPRRDVKLFEARTIDLGVSFLVDTAARAAHEGMEREQILLLLRRLEGEETLATLILTGDTSWMGKYLPSGSPVARIKSFLPFMEHLVAVDKAQGDLVLRAQGFGLSRALARRPDLFAGVASPAALWIRQQGFDALMPTLQPQLMALFQAQWCRVETGAAGSPYLRGRYIEIVILPPPETVERVKNFVRRMWRAFGPAAATMPMSNL